MNDIIVFSNWKDRVTAMMCLDGRWIVKKNSKLKTIRAYTNEELFNIWDTIRKAKAETKPFPLNH